MTSNYKSETKNFNLLIAQKIGTKIYAFKHKEYKFAACRVFRHELQCLKRNAIG